MVESIKFVRARSVTLKGIDSIDGDGIKQMSVNAMHDSIKMQTLNDCNYGVCFSVKPTANILLKAIQFPSNCSTGSATSQDLINGQVYISKLTSDKEYEFRAEPVPLSERIKAQELAQGIGTQVLVLKEPYLLEKDTLYSIMLHSITDPWFCYFKREMDCTCSMDEGCKDHHEPWKNNELIVYEGCAIYDQYFSMYKKKCCTFSGVFIYQ